MAGFVEIRHISPTIISTNKVLIINLADSPIDSVLYRYFSGDIEVVFKYLNRLSDYLFTAARYCSHKDGVPEEIYTKQDS